MTPESLKERTQWNKFLTIQIVVVVVVYLIGMYLINLHTSEKFKEWDLQTTTITDYSILFDLKEHPDLYPYFIRNIYQTQADKDGVFYKVDPINYAFKRFLRSEITEILKKES